MWTQHTRTVATVVNTEHICSETHKSCCLPHPNRGTLSQAESGTSAGKAPYLITSHQPQVSEGFAALSNLGGSTVRDLFAPSNIHRLYCRAVPPNGYQSWKDITGMRYKALQIVTSAPCTH